MEKRLFGRTGHDSTVVTFGAIVVGRNEMPQDRADKLIEMVFEHGINHVDVAAQLRSGHGAPGALDAEGPRRNIPWRQDRGS